MNNYTYITLKDKPELINEVASWFSKKWTVPKEAYLECMNAYLNGETELGWYLCLDKEKIVAGLGVIDNDFHERKDLTPNICAVYTEEEYRNHGIAGKLLEIAIEDLREKGITPVYVLTDHIGFYERYGFEFVCNVKNENEESESRIYIHK